LRHRDRHRAEGIAEVIPLEMCYLGWQESLEQYSRRVEPAAARQPCLVAAPAEVPLRPLLGVCCVIGSADQMVGG
jgi:hypothetical protein